MTSPISGEKLYHWRQWAIALGQTHQIDTYEVDWLLQGFTPLSSLSLKLGDYRSLSNVCCRLTLEELSDSWKKRVIERVPVQHIVGEVPWRNLMLKVSPHVLIPRPETELIIDITEKLVTSSPIKEQLVTGRWVDVGTGSGAIALSLATTFPEAAVHAIDISPEALKIARHNAQRNNLSHCIIFHQGSWLTPLIHAQATLSGIITNPPYIPTQVISTLQPEVANHEPHLALDGGTDGLDPIRTLIEQGAILLRTGGFFLTEIMYDQAEAVCESLSQSGCYASITTHSDLSGLNRFVSAIKTI